MAEKTKKNSGVIYILYNPSFKEYVKIGYADDLKERLKQLNKSECIPFAFRAFAVYEVKERLKDIAIHKMIDNINPNLRAIETFNGKNRKKEFYEMSTDDAYEILETIAALSGTTDRLHKLTPEGQEIIDEKIAAEAEERQTYSENTLIDKASSEVKALYSKLREALTALDGVTVEPKKLYIAFKAPRNFTDVEIKRNALKLFINRHKGELIDPREVADDVSNIGHWGNGDYRVYLTENSDFDYVLGLIKQAYKYWKERDN